MLHPETMRRLAKDRQESYLQEAKRERLARDFRSATRDFSSATHEERRDRFDVRNLRWLLLRPAGA